jgi:hypothetical protein
MGCRVVIKRAGEKPYKPNRRHTMFIDFFGIAQQVRKFFTLGKHDSRRAQA